MQYFGGKNRIAGVISSYLESIRIPGQPYLEPFVGAANIIVKMTGERTGSDIHQDIILLLKSVQNGSFEFPTSVSEEDHRKYQYDPHPSAMRAFVGFGCSYAGRWFEGYARSGKRNYCLNAANSLRKKKQGMNGIKFVHCDFEEWNPSGWLIYCDPPYANHTRVSRIKFDHERFWDVMRQWSKSNIVVVSEYEAPKDFQCVKEIPTKTDIRSSAGIRMDRIERLFQIKDVS